MTNSKYNLPKHRRKLATLRNFLRRHVLAFISKKRAESKVRELKTTFWQTESGAAFFIKGSDMETVPAAAVMDAVVNGLFLEHCPANSKVLDVGSGHGIVSKYLAKHGHSVTAFDVSDVLLKALEDDSTALGIEIRQGDVANIPARDGEFDVVVARMFLGHFPDWPEVLKEMARCCRHGGKLLIHFTASENASFGAKFGKHDCRFADSPDLNVGTDPGYYFASANQSQIQKACARAGLRVLERIPTSFFLHNRLIGHSLGSGPYETYQREMSDKLKDKAVRDYVIWFEQNVVRHMPVWFSYYNVLVLIKCR